MNNAPLEETSLDKILAKKPDEYFRLAYLVRDYVRENRGHLQDKPDDFVLEFKRHDMDVLNEDADIEDYVRSYCELHCTTFPLLLTETPSFSSFLKQKETEIIPPLNTYQDELDKLLLLQDEYSNPPLKDKKEKIIYDETSTSSKILQILGFRPDWEIKSGLSVWERELGQILAEVETEEELFQNQKIVYSQEEILSFAHFLVNK